MTIDDLISEQGWTESINVAWLKFERMFPKELTETITGRELKLMRASFHIGWKNGTDYATKVFELIIDETEKK